MDGQTVTSLLKDVRGGQPGAMDRLVPVVYEELRRIAAIQLRREQTGHTLATTGLVHEAYMRLAEIDHLEPQDRGHFFALATRQMRRVLIDHARARRSAKRGGSAVQVPLQDIGGVVPTDAETLIVLDAALSKLEVVNGRQCRVVEYRCIAGMSVEETAALLETSTATVKRDWAFARAWLHREMASLAEETAGG